MSTSLPLPSSALLGLGLALSATAACGSRSDLDALAASGEGGGTSSTTTSGTTTSGATTSSGTTGTTTTTGQIACSALTVLPISVVPTGVTAHRPHLEHLPQTGEVLMAFLAGAPGTPGTLRMASLDLFGVWPPEYSDFVGVSSSVLDFATGPGPDGPVALLERQAGLSPLLAFQIFPDISGLDIPFSTGGGEVLFAAAVPDRYFGAQRHDTPLYKVLGVGSFQPGSLPQAEGPLVCTTSEVLGAAVPSGGGFLAAFAEPDTTQPCDPAVPAPATVVTVARYEAPPGFGTFLERTEGARFDLAEPLVHLAMAQTSWGAWVAFQSDGSKSRMPPPIMAARVDAAGQAVDAPIPVSPGGLVPTAVAATSLADALAVAWVDSLDPSAPTIVVQLVHPDGTPGAATSIPTNEAWLSGRVELSGSPQGDSLLVAWESQVNDDGVALARIDCAGEP